MELKMKLRLSNLCSTFCSGLIACAMALPQSQAALLEGKAVNLQLHHQTSDPDPEHIIQGGNVVVGPGVEWPGFGDATFPPLPELVDIDLSDRQILITLLIDQPFAVREGIMFRDANDAIGPIRKVIINPATNWAGIEPIRVSPMGWPITVNVSQLAGLQGQQVLLDLVPEPAAASLLLTAIAAVTLGSRRATSARGIPPRRLLARRSYD
jgi:hypothetical protein